ncbi:DUF421 domain-containing protein [Ahrensia sp. R2A130]|uniref:DUF421 domain-containing protein n=1 Tax=Ahrensia sp. R2A130 TaxID=744979 RepID=UPI0001E0A4B5|nr:YetF domain-containing protein [Ahrensia sp. R2A130]EFL88407.1 conserved hypothetical protein [Ahrensia sp. R2A130]
MPDFIDIILRTIFLVALLILLTRLQGLRSFSKMSGFDFAITVAMGSVLAAGVTTLSTPAWKFAVAFLALFIVQGIIARLRVRWTGFEDTTDNCPMLIMEHGEILTGNLKKAGVTEADLYGKLREANALDLSRVRAVVMEPTGDVSVLHFGADDEAFSDKLLEGVKR